MNPLVPQGVDRMADQLLSQPMPAVSLSYRQMIDITPATVMPCQDCANQTPLTFSGKAGLRVAAKISLKSFLRVVCSG